MMAMMMMMMMMNNKVGMMMAGHFDGTYNYLKRIVLM
jgi:hypothetical protein